MFLRVRAKQPRAALSLDVYLDAVGRCSRNMRGAYRSPSSVSFLDRGEELRMIKQAVAFLRGADELVMARKGIRKLGCRW